MFEDRWIVVVNKPHGLPSQAPRGGGASVRSFMQRDHRYVALHHRLDTPASGLMVLAVHRDANAELARQFQGHEVQRTYRAVLLGSVADGIWDRPVGGRPARTAFTACSECVEGVTACRLVPYTGRTHQLRIHAALAGHPICGDRRHGGETGGRWPRLALHAATLTLTHPVTGAPHTWTAALPEDLAPLWAATGAAE